MSRWFSVVSISFSILSVTSVVIVSDQSLAQVIAQAQNPQTAIVQSQQAQLKAKAYRVRNTSQSQGQSIQTVIEYVAPDRYRLLGNNQEILLIGSKAYIKQDNQWQSLPINPSQMIAEILKSIGDTTRITDAKLLGSENVNGIPTQVYAYKTKTQIGNNLTTSTVKLWVGQTDFLPRKVEVKGEFAGIASNTTQLIEYDSAIQIDPPNL